MVVTADHFSACPSHRHPRHFDIIFKTPFCITSQRIVPRTKHLHPCLASCRSGNFGHRVGCAFADHTKILFLSIRGMKGEGTTQESRRACPLQKRNEREGETERGREREWRERKSERENENRMPTGEECPQHGAGATARLHTPSSASLLQGFAAQRGKWEQEQAKAALARDAREKARLRPFGSQIGAKLLPHMYLSNTLSERSDKGRGAPTQPRRSWSCFCFRLRPRPSPVVSAAILRAEFVLWRFAQCGRSPCLQKQLSEQRLGHDALFCHVGVRRHCHFSRGNNRSWFCSLHHLLNTARDF